jgi:PBSX family phage terminase large subunit
MAKFSQKALRFIRRHPKYDAVVNILEGSVRSGKTWAMIPKLIFLLNTYEVEGDRIIFGVSKDTIYNNVLTQIFDFVGTDNYSYNRQTGELYLFGVRWNVVGAKDEGSEKYIRGRTVGIAYGDELTLIPKSFFDMMLTRMSPEGARLYGTTNPGSPFHYLKKEWLDDAQKRAAGIVWSEHFVLDDNLSLSEDKKTYYRTVFKGVFYDLFILGKWVLAEGVIYADCLSEENYYDDDARPLGLLSQGGYSEMFIPVDYGTGNPTVFLHIVDDGQTYWVDDEYYWDSREQRQQKTDGQYITDLIEWRNSHAPRGCVVIVDPSAASLKAEMDLRGVWNEDAENEVLDGIRSVANLLAKKKLKIHKRCAKLIAELGTYSWDTKAGEKGEDKPIKKNDHAPDALRYFVQTKVPAWRIAA